MCRGRLSGFMAAVGAAAVLAAPAAAATPGQSYNAAKNPVVQGYGNPIVTVVLSTPPPPPAVQGRQKTISSKPSASTPVQKAGRTGTLPFTGIELTAFALIGGTLLASGLLLRATARGRTSR